MPFSFVESRNNIITERLIHNEKYTASVTFSADYTIKRLNPVYTTEYAN